MNLLRILIQFLLLPIVALALPVMYGIAWLREMIGDLSDLTPQRVPVVVTRTPRVPILLSSRMARRDR